jgi:methylglyoxal synthase
MNQQNSHELNTKKIKKIALVAHDNRKTDLSEWVKWNSKILSKHHLVCTGTTGLMVEEALQETLPKSDFENVTITKLKSGPLGGDQQLGAMISDDKIDMLIFLWDPMQPQPHDVDVKALLRIATLYNIPTAINRSTADFMIASTLFATDYKPVKKDYSVYLNRKWDQK